LPFYGFFFRSVNARQVPSPARSVSVFHSTNTASGLGDRYNYQLQMPEMIASGITGIWQTPPIARWKVDFMIEKTFADKDWLPVDRFVNKPVDPADLVFIVRTLAEAWTFSREPRR
jgi:hypothetical protein